MTRLRPCAPTSKRTTREIDRQVRVNSALRVLECQVRPLIVSNAATSLVEGVLLVLFPIIGLNVAGATGVSVLATAAALPWVLLAVPVGYIVDHFRRSTVLMWSNVCRAAALLGLIILMALGNHALLVLAVFAFFLWSCEVLGQVVRQSLVPEYVVRSEISSASADLALGAQLCGGFIGPAVGGFLGGVNPILALFLGLLGALVGLVVALFVPRSADAIAAKGFKAVVRASTVGFAVLFRDRALVVLSIVGFFATITWFSWQVAFPVWAVGAHGVFTKTIYGLLLSSLAVGGIVGARVLKMLLRRFKPSSLLVASLAAWAIWFGLPALLPTWWGVLLALLVGGAAGTAWNVLSISTRQSMVDVKVLGRVGASYRLITRSGRPLGSAAGGLLLAGFAPPPLFVGFAAFVLLLSGVLMFVTRRERAEASSLPG